MMGNLPFGVGSPSSSAARPEGRGRGARRESAPEPAAVTAGFEPGRGGWSRAGGQEGGAGGRGPGTRGGRGKDGPWREDTRHEPGLRAGSDRRRAEWPRSYPVSGRGQVVAASGGRGEARGVLALRAAGVRGGPGAGAGARGGGAAAARAARGRAACAHAAERQSALPVHRVRGGDDGAAGTGPAAQALLGRGHCAGTGAVGAGWVERGPGARGGE